MKMKKEEEEAISKWVRTFNIIKFDNMTNSKMLVAPGSLIFSNFSIWSTIKIQVIKIQVCRTIMCGRVCLKKISADIPKITQTLD